jgi:hypothetical protein
LWGTSPATVASANPAPLSGRTPELRAPGRLDLFSDRSGSFSS